MSLQLDPKGAGDEMIEVSVENSPLLIQNDDVTKEKWFIGHMRVLRLFHLVEDSPSFLNPKVRLSVIFILEIGMFFAWFNLQPSILNGPWGDWWKKGAAMWIAIFGLLCIFALALLTGLAVISVLEKQSLESFFMAIPRKERVGGGLVCVLYSAGAVAFILLQIVFFGVNVSHQNWGWLFLSYAFYLVSIWLASVYCFSVLITVILIVVSYRTQVISTAKVMAKFPDSFLPEEVEKMIQRIGIISRDLRVTSDSSEVYLAIAFGVTLASFFIVFLTSIIIIQNVILITYPIIALLVCLFLLFGMGSIEATSPQLRESASALRAHSSLSAEQKSVVDSLLLYVSNCPVYWRMIIPITTGVVSTAITIALALATYSFPKIYALS